VAHSIRSWEEDRSDSARKTGVKCRRRSEGVTPLLKSRDPHLEGGEKHVQHERNQMGLSR